MSLRTIVGAALTALTLTVSAHAATITAEKDGCDPKDCYLIKVDGKIELEDAKKFEAVIKANGIKVAVVYLDSPGGNMLGGLMMGLSIHEHNFATMVYYDTRCVSMCSAMWMAGGKRYVTPTSKIGFHQPYSVDKRGRIHPDAQAVAFMKKYYAEIGVPKPAADFLVAADPKDVYWLNGDLAAGFKIDVTTLEDQKPASNTCMPGATTCPAATLPKAFIESLFTKKPL